MGDREEDQSICDETLCSESDSKRVNLNAEKLFNENQALVGYVLNKLGMYQGPNFEDLQQQGYLGLWEACLKFDESKGFSFATYAVPTITGRVVRYAREQLDPVRLPRSHKTIKSIMGRHGFTLPLSEEEIAIIVEEGDNSVTERAIRKYQDTVFLSLDTPYGEEENSNLGDTLASEGDFRDKVEELTEDQISMVIDKLMSYLTFKSTLRDLIEEYLYAYCAGIKLKQVDLADKYGIAQCHISKGIYRARAMFKKHEKEILEMLGY